MLILAHVNSTRFMAKAWNYVECCTIPFSTPVVILNPVGIPAVFSKTFIHASQPASKKQKWHPLQLKPCSTASSESSYLNNDFGLVHFRNYEFSLPVPSVNMNLPIYGFNCYTLPWNNALLWYDIKRPQIQCISFKYDGVFTIQSILTLWCIV
jgi:hypothetical protein